MGKLARYDSSRVKLRTGEYQKADGRYEFRYTVFGKKYSVYAKSLDELRYKEVEIYSVKTAKQVHNFHPKKQRSRLRTMLLL